MVGAIERMDLRRFFFDVVLASVAHFLANDGGQWLSLTAMLMLVISRIFEVKIFINKNDVV